MTELHMPDDYTSDDDRDGPQGRSPSLAADPLGGVFSEGHAMVLGMAASGAPLGAVLHAVIDLLEAEVGDARCSVLLVDEADGLLRVAAAPSLPEPYLDALAEGVPVAMGEGSCGEAACSGKPVIVSDVATSPRWERYAAGAVRYGLRACWSVPILGEAGKALGALACYYDTPREPEATEVARMESFAQLVAVAVRQDRTNRALERSRRSDPVTGLPGREQLVPAVEDALRQVQGDPEGWAAVATVEMRRLRQCNQAFGYAGGDELIMQTATRLRMVVGTAGAVFRTGGSGFTVVLRQRVGHAGRDLGEEMLRALSSPVTIAGTAFSPGPRIGLAVASASTSGTAELIEGAQVALQEARRSASPVLVPAQAPRAGGAARGLRLESDLRRGIAAGELIVHYQTQYALDTGRLVGVEALVRWDHPERGLLVPGTFLHAVSSGNLHGELLATVIEQACRDAARWQGTHPDLPVVLSVNLAADNLLDPGLVGHIEEALRASGLPGGLLCLEVTEQAALSDMAAAEEAMGQLHDLGVRIAMDDFGTGYSSLSYARRLPIDMLKIDRAFVQRINEEPRDRAVVAAVVALGNGLGIDVLAEGVETEDQRRVVRDLGCRQAQGYLWSTAVPAEAIDAQLAALEEEGSAVAAVPGPSGDQLTWQEHASTFLAHVVHEARSPLTVLQLQAGLLQQQAASPEQAEAAATIERQVVALDEILSATADVYDLSVGALPLHRATVDLGALARDVTGDLAATVAPTVEVAVVDDIVVHADPSRVRQILVNLLTNAGKHAPPASVVDVTMEADDAGARLTVRDRGPGVPPDKAELIFRQFGRADESKPGLGLGLYIARQLARSHGGDLTYEPAHPTGAAFTLTLPVAAPV